MRPNKATSSILIIIYFGLCLLLHEEAEKPFEWFVKNFGNANLSLLLNIVFGISVLLLIFYVLKKLVEHPQRMRMLIFWLVALIFSYIGYYTLMPYKSEGIHFVQYCIMGYLCYHVLGKSWPALMLAYVLGVSDELYQYIWGGSVYLDFNDMVLNFLGSFLGILLYSTMNPASIISGSDLQWRPGWSMCILIVCCSLGFAVLHYSGLVCIYADDGCNISLIKWDRGRLSYDFWDCTDWGKCWHRIKVWEGIIVLPVLALVSFISFNKLDIKHGHA